MRCVIRNRLFQSLVAMGILPNPQDQFGKSRSHDKSLNTAKEKLEEFMKGLWPASQKLVKSLDGPRASVEVAWVSGQRTLQKLFRSEMLLSESKYVDFVGFYGLFWISEK